MFSLSKRLLLGAFGVGSLLVGGSIPATAYSTSLLNTPDSTISELLASPTTARTGKLPHATSSINAVSPAQLQSLLVPPVEPSPLPASSTVSLVNITAPQTEKPLPEPIPQSAHIETAPSPIQSAHIEIAPPESAIQSEHIGFTAPASTPDLAIPASQPTSSNVEAPGDTETPAITATPKRVLIHRQVVPKTSLVKEGGKTVMQITPTLQTRVVEAAPEVADPQTEAIGTVADSLLVNRSLSGYAYSGMDGMPSYNPPALPTDSGDQGMVYPLAKQAPITSGFGWRWGRMHKGLDLAAPTGTPVLAAFSGQIVSAGWNNGGYGYLIVIQAANNQTYYAHLSQLLVREGQTVTAGQVIGRVGSTGNSTGPHLHFELRLLSNGAWVPTNAIAQVKVAAANIGRNMATASPNPTAPAQATNDFNVRVALGVAHSQVWISTSAPAWVIDVQGRALMQLEAMQNYSVTQSGGAIAINGMTLPGAIYIKPISTNALSGFNNHWYRGTLSISSHRNGLTVVNHVNTEHYLASVVGGEVYPSWQLEALKAHAVAARSYVMYHLSHPLSQQYDICATEACQVYKGVASEHGSTNQAVYSTRGQVLLDAAGKVLMAQYASTQALVNEAHRGYGMAQWGAQDLAQAGWNYLQILSHYYR